MFGCELLFLSLADLLSLLGGGESWESGHEEGAEATVTVANILSYLSLLVLSSGALQEAWTLLLVLQR